MANAWYPFYSGDYGRDTAELSLIEHGAYRLLLDHYYSTGGPLPADKERLYRLCRAFQSPEQAAIDKVVSQFFALKSDGYHNGRADRQLLDMAQKRANQSEKGRRGAEKRWNTPGNASASGTGIARAMAKPEPEPKPLQESKSESESNPEKGKSSEVGEADMSQNTCDASPAGDTGILSFPKSSSDSDAPARTMVQRLGHRELKGLRTILLRSIRNPRSPEPFRASFRSQLAEVEKALGLSGAEPCRTSQQQLGDAGKLLDTG